MSEEGLIRIHPRMWHRRVEVTRANGRKRLRILAVVGGVLVLAGGGFMSLHTSLFAASNLSVVGAVHTSGSQVLESSGLSKHPPLIDIDRAEMVQKIEALPWVRTAEVEEHWPDSVTVVLTERKPVAAIDPAPGHRRLASWDLVDASGRILAVVGSRPAGLPALIVIIPPGDPGTYLSASDQPAVTVASSLPRSIATKVTSIELVSGGVTLLLRGGLTAAIGAPVDLGAKYEALASVLASASVTPGDEIDVTVPEEPTIGSS
jgi:cell division septal protein FtsQ